MLGRQSYQLGEKVGIDENRESEFKGGFATKTYASVHGALKSYIDEYVNAFLNTCPGVIFFGIENDGRVTGLHVDRQQRDALLQLADNIIGAFEPPVEPELFRLRFIPIEGDGATEDLFILEIHVSRGNYGTFCNGSQQFYIRRNSGNVRMPLDMLKRRLSAEAEISPSGNAKQLPRITGDFTGRDNEISDALKAIAGGSSILHIYGMAGAGKTTLALAISHRLVAGYPGGQLLLDLRGTDIHPLTEVDVMTFVLRAYLPDREVPNDTNTLRARYYSILNSRSTLLVFDNAVDLGQVQSILPPGNCLLIVTSRTRFYPPGSTEIGIGELPTADSQKMLRQIAPHIGAIAEQIAYLCGNLPMALELAGRFLREQADASPEIYAQSLSLAQTRFDKVEASWKLSYDLLPSELKTKWPLLAVFPESFNLRAATSVWGCRADEASSALNKLARLSLVSWLAPASASVLGEEPMRGRYRLHDLGREFGNKLMTLTNRKTARLRHATHYGRVMVMADQLYQLGGDNLGRALRLYDLEAANIVAARQWVVGNISHSDVIARLCLAYVASGHLLDLREKPKDQISVHRAAREAARRLKLRDVEAAQVGNIAAAYATIGKRAQALEIFYKQLAMVRMLNNSYMECQVLNNIANALAEEEDTAKALETYDRAFDIGVKAGNKLAQARALQGVGSIYNSTGDTQRSIAKLQEALEIYRTESETRYANTVLIDLADAHADAGHLRLAEDLYQQALSTALELGDEVTVGKAMINLAFLMIDLENPDQSIEYGKRALEIARKHDNREDECGALNDIGMAYSSKGDPTTAIPLYTDALIIAQQLSLVLEGGILSNLAAAHARLGQHEQAIELFGKALGKLRERGVRKHEEITLVSFGTLYSELGQQDLANDLFHKAMVIAQSMHDLVGEADSIFHIAKSAEASGDRITAVQLADKALALLANTDWPLIEDIKTYLATGQSTTE